MIESEKKFISLQPHEGGSITFGGGTKGLIIRKGQVKLNKKTLIDNVNLVKNLKFDLLSVSKLCDNRRNKVIFYTREVFVKDLKTKEVIIKGNRHNDIFKVDKFFDPSSKVCLSTLKEGTRI